MTLDPWVAALVGQVLGGYRIDSYRRGGNFGRVFETTKLSTGSRFAIKVLVPTGVAQAVTEFDNEGVLLQKLINSSAVINLVESGTEMISVNINGTPIQLDFRYHVLALASGALDELISDPVSRAALPWQERLSHWRGAIKGVHQMHLNNVAHRDLKCSNCLLMLQGRNSEVRLGDLGRSKDFSLAPSLPRNEYLTGRGDLQYAPPEYLYYQGGSTETDFRNADLYGLGSLLVELATGHPMTAHAIGSWMSAISQGLQDFHSGNLRDLAALRPRFHRAIEQLSAEFAPAIRHDAVVLVRQLCDPVPSARQPKRPPGKRHVPDKGLLWLLRRADILSRLVSVQSRQRNHRRHNAHRRSAS